MKIADSLGRLLIDFLASCLTAVMRGTKNENKEVGTVLNLFQNCVGTSVLFVYAFVLILYHNSL
jgi:hypothetical protein